MIKFVRRMLSGYSEMWDHDRQIEYLPQSIKLEEASHPYSLKITIALISITFIIFIIWSAFAEIYEVTHATGKVVPYGFVQVVQHMGGGMVTDIMVKEGEIVPEGAVLLRIDDGSSRENLSEYLVKETNLKMKSERLKAFVEDRKPNFSNMLDISDAEIKRQMITFNSMIKAREKEEEVIEEQIAHAKKEKKILEIRVSSLKKNLELSEEVYNMHASLREKGYSSKLEFIKAEKERNKIIANLENTKNKLEQNSNVISEYKNRLSSLMAKHKNQAYKELDLLESTMHENKEIIKKLKSRVNRLDIKSPVYGMVKGLKINTVGGVIEAGNTLMEIVPLDKDLVAEIQIQPNDIGHVFVGHSVRVKVDSFDFARYGAVKGELDSISATTFLDVEGVPYYRGIVSLSKKYVGEDYMNNLLMPGMTLQADILTGKKTLLYYLLKPIHLSIELAMSQR